MSNPQPSGPVRKMDLFLDDRVQRLEDQLAALQQRPLRNAGEFSTYTTAGVLTFHTGPNYNVPQLADGTPQWTTEIYDQYGHLHLQLFSPFALGAAPQILSLFDHLGNTVLATDANGGLAIPWMPIPMLPYFALPAGIFDYSSVAVNVTEKTYWAGKIGRVAAPKIGLSGVWGAASGTNTTRYKLKFGSTVVGTWDIAGLEVSSKGPFNIQPTAGLGSNGVDVVLTAQTLSGTGSFAIQVVDCTQRQT